MHPNDKQELLDVGGFETYSRELLRKVFPRIIAEAHDVVYAGNRRKPEIRDIVFFYFLLQSYIDGQETKTDGARNDRFGACFLAYDAIQDKMRIDPHRIKLLANILETNGIIRVADRWEGTRRFKWYFPSFCPRITDDGYLVDEDGERITPDLELYKAKKRGKKRNASRAHFA